MATPRKRQICLEQTPYYHCVSRCVRRAFLCGVDRLSGRSFEHRRTLIESRLHQLASVFAIDVAAYAIMSNHHHVVLRVDSEKAHAWTSSEICERWAKLFKLPDPVRKHLAGEHMEAFERATVDERIAVFRERLMSISWFMKCLNTDIARAANREDKCTGRFFEGRFKCQALLDESALLKCMAYVDLNPVRAGLAKEPESATHTSLAHRVKTPQSVLLPFAGGRSLAPSSARLQSAFKTASIPFSLDEYRDLVRWTAEHTSTPTAGAPLRLLRSVNLDVRVWQNAMQAGALERKRVLGAPQRVRAFAAAIGQAWMWGAAAGSV